MKLLKSFFLIALLFAVLFSFAQCSSTKKFETKAPITFDQVYYQHWVAGIEGGGSGTNIFIPIKSTTIVLDSVYFKGRSAKLKIEQPGSNLYIGRFLSQRNREQHNIIMSSDSIAEYGNKLPVKVEKIPFELKPTECVVSYKDGKITKYFKIENIIKEKPVHYPMMRKN